MVTSDGELCLLTAASVCFEIFPRVQCVYSWNPNGFAQSFSFSHSPPFSLLLSDHQLFIIVVFWLMHCNDMEATFLCNSAHTYYHFIFPQNQLLHSLACVLKKKFDGGEVATGSSLDLQSRLRDSWGRRSCEVEMLQTSIGTSDIYNPVGRLGGNSHRSGDSQGYRRRRRRWWWYEWWAELGLHDTQFCPVCVSTKGPSIK